MLAKEQGRKVLWCQGWASSPLSCLSRPKPSSWGKWWEAAFVQPTRELSFILYQTVPKCQHITVQLFQMPGLAQGTYLTPIRLK